MSSALADVTTQKSTKNQMDNDEAVTYLMQYFTKGDHESEVVLPSNEVLAGSYICIGNLMQYLAKPEIIIPFNSSFSP
jgi:hypothetical protein